MIAETYVGAVTRSEALRLALVAGVVLAIVFLRLGWMLRGWVEAVRRERRTADLQLLLDPSGITEAEVFAPIDVRPAGSRSSAYNSSRAKRRPPAPAGAIPRGRASASVGEHAVTGSAAVLGEGEADPHAARPDPVRQAPPSSRDLPPIRMWAPLTKELAGDLDLDLPPERSGRGR
jgi:hypothetical protein